jgi:hypothetical protein
VTCPKVLPEVGRILHSKVSVPDSLISEYLELIRRDVTLAEGKETPDVPLKDVDGLEITAAAITGKADSLVTGGRKLQDIRPRAKTACRLPESILGRIDSPARRCA